MTLKLGSEEIMNSSGEPRFADRTITGTLMWYYAICEREVWLASRGIYPEDDHYKLEIGRLTHEYYYREEKKEVEFEGAKIDVVENKLVCEVKTSSSFLEAAKLQLAYYLYRLEKLGIQAEGEIRIPRERKKFKLVLDSELRAKVEDAIKGIQRIANRQSPPPPRKTRFCRHCAYSDFCWGDEL